MKRLLSILILLLLVSGCAPWIRTGGPHSAPEQNVSLDLPDGWMRLNTGEYLYVTRDGVYLQNILVEKIHITDELTHTKKKFRSGMLPHEQAEVIFDNKKTDEKVLNFVVQEIKPATLGGNSGFRAVTTHKDKDDLKYKSLFFGFMEGEWFYIISYTAPQRHYFEKDRKTFEKVLASFRLLDKS